MLSKIRVFISGRLLLFSILLTTIYFLIPLFRFWIANIEMYSNKSRVTIGLRLHEIDKRDIPQLKLETWQEQYLISQDVPLPVISLEYINVPKKLLAEDNLLCINEIKITGNFDLSKTGLVIYHLTDNNDQNVCFPSGKNVVLTKDFQIDPFVYDKYIEPFFYPYDQRTISYDVQTKMSLKKTGGDFIVDQAVIVSTDPPRWIANTFIINSQIGGTKSLKTTLFRYPLTQLLSIFVPISVLLIIRILPSLTNEIGSVWEVTVGLILGLWGLSEVLIPPYIDYPTIMETIILILYVGIAIFVMYFIRNQRRKISRTVSADTLALDIPVRRNKTNLFIWAIKKSNEGIAYITIAEAFFIRSESVNSINFKRKLIAIGEKFITS